jgi:regulatory protein YycI of two-component signal transduction system YycFG
VDWLIYVVIFLIISGFIFERIVKKRSAKEPKNSLSLEKLNDDKIEKNPKEDKATGKWTLLIGQPDG